jgi:fused signal recognition particle receptor
MNLFGRRDKAADGLRRSREGWFGRLAGLLGREQMDEETWEQAEELLLGADVGTSATMALLDRVQDRIRTHSASPGGALETLKEEMRAVLANAGTPSLAAADGPPPLVILVVGVNGAGKTTSIAKLAALYREQGKRVVLGAADTFRAAAIEQLQAWGQRVGAEVVAHKQGADPGAVAYDAFQAARARNADVLIIDTAGRLHTKSNLMEEMTRVARVLSRLEPTAPHQTLLVMDATTGQNGLAQARAFTESVECTGIILAKLDGTARGGVVLAIGDQLRVPVLFIGTGEGLDDLAPFDAEEFVEALFEGGAREARS